MATEITPDIDWRIQDFFTQPNPYKSILVLLVSVILAYVLSRFVALFIIFIAQKVAVRSDNESDELKAVRLRQVETYLGVTVALVRVVIVAIVAYLAWRFLSPGGSKALGGSGAAAIGASAVFIVVASQTIGTLLRDITAGSMMIIEQWYKVGDHIKVEPFLDVAGVVERFTLRSTRIRNLSGEIIWIHNQQIASVHVTPKGVRTVAVDVLVRDAVRGEALVREVVNELPIGPMLLAQPLKVSKVQEWTKNASLITVTGKTIPGREWLIEKYFINVLMQENNVLPRKDRVIFSDPIARYSDPDVTKRFRRTIRVAKEQAKADGE